MAPRIPSAGEATPSPSELVHRLERQVLVRAFTALALLLRAAVLAGRADPTPVSGQAGAIVLNVSASPTPVSVGGTVRISFSATQPPTITGFTIDFGDGQRVATSAANNSATHAYNAAGAYTITVTATDSTGNHASASVIVTVEAEAAVGAGAPPGAILSAGTATLTIFKSLVTTSGQAMTGTLSGFRFTLTGEAGGNLPTQTQTTNQLGQASFTNLPAGVYSLTESASAGTTFSSMTINGVAAQKGQLFTIQAGGTDNANVVNIQATAPPPPAPGVPVTFQPGWNLVSGPASVVMTGNAGPLYTFQGGDTAYEVIPNGSQLTAGQGYWTYFPGPTTVALPIVSPRVISVSLPAGQFVMIGNPNDGNALLSGADVVFTYDPANGYRSVSSLDPGQGAWAFSAGGGTLTIGGRSVRPATAPPPATPSEPSPPTLGPPAAPSDLVAADIDSTHIQLTWTNNATNAVSIQVYDSMANEQIAAADGSATSTVLSVPPGGHYCAYVYAYNSAGYSDPSNVACADTPG